MALPAKIDLSKLSPEQLEELKEQLKNSNKEKAAELSEQISDRENQIKTLQGELAELKNELANVEPVINPLALYRAVRRVLCRTEAKAGYEMGVLVEKTGFTDYQLQKMFGNDGAKEVPYFRLDGSKYRLLSGNERKELKKQVATA